VGRGCARHARRKAPLTAFVDTNVLILHLTGDPPEMAARATALLAGGEQLLLADLVLAECVFVLESFYEVPRSRVAELMRSAIALPSLQTLSPESVIRALEVYELDRLEFDEAYLVAMAEATGVRRIASFDRSIDRAASVERVELGAGPTTLDPMAAPFTSPLAQELSEDVLERLVRYAKIETTSRSPRKQSPSTACQLDLARLLLEELTGLGLEDPTLDENGYVTATLPGTGATAIGLIAHVDTSPDAPGKGVQPLVHRDYNGGVIALPNGDTVLDPKTMPELREREGHDIVTTSSAIRSCRARRFGSASHQTRRSATGRRSSRSPASPRPTPTRSTAQSPASSRTRPSRPPA
jgi:predicted nucleic acid-binding protein